MCLGIGYPLLSVCHGFVLPRWSRSMKLAAHIPCNHVNYVYIFTSCECEMSWFLLRPSAAQKRKQTDSIFKRLPPCLSSLVSSCFLYTYTHIHTLFILGRHRLPHWASILSTSVSYIAIRSLKILDGMLTDVWSTGITLTDFESGAIECDRTTLLHLIIYQSSYISFFIYHSLWSCHDWS